MFVSLLGTRGEQVMCCRYSCQNGQAILAQVSLPSLCLCRKTCFPLFAVMAAIDSTSSPMDPYGMWYCGFILGVGRGFFGGASDASAHPDGRAYIGGWADKENPSKKDTWWFDYQVPLEDRPWAHKKGDPTRRISALEMLGTLILAQFLLIKGGRTLLRTRLSLISDNQGNIFPFLNQKTKQMPICLSDAAHRDAPRSPASSFTHEAGLQPVSEAFPNSSFYGPCWTASHQDQTPKDVYKTDPRAT